MVSNPANYSLSRLLLLLEKVPGTPVIFFNTEKQRSKVGNLHFVPFNYWSLLKILWRYRKQNILLVSQTIQYDRLAIFLKRIFNIKVVIRRGGIFWGKQYLESGAFNTKIRNFKHLNKADLFISTADGTPVNLFLDKVGVKIEKRQVLMNGFPKINPGKRKRRNKLMCISRLSPEKGVDLVINAFAEAVKSLDKSYSLDIIGDGPSMMEFNELAKKLGIVEKVNFLGHIDNAVHRLTEAKLFINPLANNTLIECIVTKTPVITFEIGEFQNLYGHFPNVFLLPYEKGGCGAIPLKMKYAMKHVLARKIIDVLSSYDQINTEYDIDFKHYGWEQRLNKELDAYNRLFNENDPH